MTNELMKCWLCHQEGHSVCPTSNMNAMKLRCRQSGIARFIKEDVLINPIMPKWIKKEMLYVECLLKKEESNEKILADYWDNIHGREKLNQYIDKWDWFIKYTNVRLREKAG